MTDEELKAFDPCCFASVDIDDVENMLQYFGHGSFSQEIVAKNTLWDGSETTECGSLSYSVANAPAYLIISGTTLTITSDSLDDEEDIAIVTVHVTVTDNPCVAEPLDYCVDFIVGLSCPTDTICDFTGPFVPETLPEVGCFGGDGGPQTLSGYTGVVGDNPGYDDWYIEYGNYMLTKIKLYGDSEVTSGFEAYFDAYPPSEFYGWP